VFSNPVVAAVDEQPCRVARFDGMLRNPIWRQLIVEVSHMHGWPGYGADPPRPWNRLAHPNVSTVEVVTLRTAQGF
jgi:hypothetical protein